MLVLLAAEFGDWQSAEVLQAAVVVELTHLATLYHDDVMDEATLRRGVASANIRWDNSVAILSGDFLFSRASNLLADLGPEAVRIQARTFERLVIGQIKESVGATAGADAVGHYIEVLEDKTGSLISTSGRFGAMFAGCPESIVETLTMFGERIGWPSSSQTIWSISPPAMASRARPRGAICGKASIHCRRCSPWRRTILPMTGCASCSRRPWQMMAITPGVGAAAGASRGGTGTRGGSAVGRRSPADVGAAAGHPRPARWELLCDYVVTRTN